MEDTNTLKDIGSRIRTARKKNNMTMKELGNKVGLSESSISKYEKGLIGSIDINLVNKISKVLDVELSELIPDAYFSTRDDICLQSTESGVIIRKTENKSTNLEGLRKIIYSLIDESEIFGNDEHGNKQKSIISYYVAELVDEIVDNELDEEDIEKLTSDAKYMGKSRRKNIVFVKNPANTKIPGAKAPKKNNQD